MTFSPDDKTTRSPSPIWAGLMAVCPVCGKGKLFSGLLAVSDRCSHCDFPLAKHDAADGPAYIVMCLMLLLVMIGAAWLELIASPPLWLHLAVWFPFILIGSVILLRTVKSILIAYDVRHRFEQYLDASERSKDHFNE